MERTLDYNVRLAELQQTASGLAARTLGGGKERVSREACLFVMVCKIKSAVSVPALKVLKMFC
jgi:hypothetical protein